MKVCLVLVALLATVLAQAPGGRPSGRLILLPARPDLEGFPQKEDQNPHISQVTDNQSERLVDSGEYYVLLEDGKLQMVKYTTAPLTKEEEPDQDATQAKYQQPQQYQQSQQYQQPQQYQQSQQSQQTQEYQKPQQYQQSEQYQQPQAAYYISASNDFPHQSAKIQAQPKTAPQVEFVQFGLPGSQFTQTKLQYKAPTEAAAEVKEEKETTEGESGFQASVQYRDVKPISAPIYAYNPAPLVRIVRNL